MGRPPLPLGTYGRIKVYAMGPKSFRARARYRDYDGVTRPVERVGPSRSAAENNLKTALRDRGRGPTDGEITADSTIAAVAELWLRTVDESDRAIRTKVAYRDVWRRCLEQSAGRLRVRDMRVSRVERVIRDVREHHGSSTAQQARSVLSGMLGLAVRMDALDANPIREVSASSRKPKKAKTALTEQDVAELAAYLRGSEAAKKYDLVDMVTALSGLGCRIGELLALDWTKVDDVAGAITIEGTVVRVPGSGLIVQEHTKSSAGMRTITPPRWVIDVLRRRHDGSHGPWVFPSARGTLRDPDTTRSQLRSVVKDTAWQGLHPHVFRHLVATRLDAAGLSAREIADYLGHERVSMTQDVYMSRRTTGAAARAAMDGLDPTKTVERPCSDLDQDRDT